MAESKRECKYFSLLVVETPQNFLLEINVGARVPRRQEIRQVIQKKVRRSQLS